jgi:hypothetical protein
MRILLDPNDANLEKRSRPRKKKNKRKIFEEFVELREKLSVQRLVLVDSADPMKRMK